MLKCYINIFKDKNLMNHHFMRYNMMRKDVQKALTRSGLGENAYINGDSSNPSMLIPMPSYTYNHNYNEFASTINEDEKRGFLTTRTTNIDGTQVNNYFDFEPSQSDITTINVNDIDGYVVTDNDIDVTESLVRHNVETSAQSATFIPSSFDSTNSVYDTTAGDSGNGVYSTNYINNGLTDHTSSTRCALYAV